MKGVYFLIDNKEVVYVGQSSDLNKRVSSHRDKLFTHYVLHTCSNRRAVEKRFIKLLQPKLNKNSLGDLKLPYIIRLKGSLLDKIKEVADDNNRSSNGEITQTLEERYE